MKNQTTILVVDDEIRLTSLVKTYLVQDGYKVLTAQTGLEALEVTKKEIPDLIILDLMMPEMDGYSFMQEYRRKANTPIILLTARVDDEEKVIGLELGADDYVTKPFRPRELTARVHAILRRSEKDSVHNRSLQFEELFLSQDDRVVKVDGEMINLTPSEFNILSALMSAPGKVFSRLDLLDIIQGVRYEGYERTIDTHIKNLRAKLVKCTSRYQYIHTVYGAGYRLQKK